MEVDFALLVLSVNFALTFVYCHKAISVHMYL